MNYVFYKSELTGNSWWPVNFATHTISFENNQTYKLYEQVYVANTGTFRCAWAQAARQETWNALNKKAP